MPPAAGDGSSPAPIDRPILEFLQQRLQGLLQVDQASITDASEHLELRVDFDLAYYPSPIQEVRLSVRWYTNDDFKIHYQEDRADRVWKIRWDRHPNPHNTRDHFHPPPHATTPGDDASWPTDHRDVLRLVLDSIEERITELWEA